MNTQAINNRIQDIAADATQWRRDLHRHPQTGYQETYMNGIITGKLTEWGIPFESGIAQTGVVAWIDGQTPGADSIALRADIDALDITEQSGQPWASETPGKMHGCGHDGHTATLLGAARYLSETRRFAGRVYLFFQPAEEGQGGAMRMIKEGLFDKYPAQRVFGMHNWPPLPLGAAGTRFDGIAACSDEIVINVTGRGGHAAFPDACIDPVYIASLLVVQLQSVVSRSVKTTHPVVLSITNLNAGTGANNVIPDRAELTGTVRAFSEEDRVLAETRMRAICDGIAQAHGATVTLHYNRNYDPTINTRAETELCLRVAGDVLGADKVDTNIDPWMAAEDFGAYLKLRPGCYILMGQGAPADKKSPHNHGLHSPFYDFNDDFIAVGMQYWVRLVETALPAPAKTAS